MATKFLNVVDWLKQALTMDVRWSIMLVDDVGWNHFFSSVHFSWDIGRCRSQPQMSWLTVRLIDIHLSSVFQFFAFSATTLSVVIAGFAHLPVRILSIPQRLRTLTS